MVMSLAGLGTEKSCAGEDQQQLYTTGMSSHQRGRPTSANPQLSDSNKNLILGPRLVLDTKRDWPNDSRS
jgi:hypothetical protein